ncbi:MAG: hypothetical protein ACE5F5_08705 [Acidimicrobiia bacterium]
MVTGVDGSNAAISSAVANGTDANVVPGLDGGTANPGTVVDGTASPGTVVVTSDVAATVVDGSEADDAHAAITSTPTRIRGLRWCCTPVI